MRVLVQLSNAVRAFQLEPRQLADLAARAIGHEIGSVQTELEFMAALPSAEAVVVWRCLPEWYLRAPGLRHVFTPSAGREPFAPDPSGRVQLHFGRFHGVILALADHVVCVLPGDTGTDHFLDSSAFASMKPSACVYNLGRGNAIDLESLQRALLQGRIAGAFLDVLSQEPLPADSPLWTARNLYLTPHASAISGDYLDLYLDELAAQLAQLTP